MIILIVITLLCLNLYLNNPSNCIHQIELIFFMILFHLLAATFLKFQFIFFAQIVVLKWHFFLSDNYFMFHFYVCDLIYVHLNTNDYNHIQNLFQQNGTKATKILPRKIWCFFVVCVWNIFPTRQLFHLTKLRVRIT